ncbi:Gfo/Idh/MocA family oxidoreductase [Altericista sp. CCNU0014]|uniref:Gfo/Idh/MocA family oxidoreductase n=1 Tax=Altericista sp. CCNU0014 TaxID=3082949 RepID=UPI00384A7675
MPTTQASSNPQRKIRYAVVGLGWFAQSAALPAFAHAENSELIALVSDDPAKLAEISQKYSSVQRTFSYAEYDDCLNSGLIDAVYIALPNHLHCEYTVRAANAKVHVLCEKPMAVTEDECQQTIEACDRNGVKLMIAYRLHFEEANLQAVEIVKSGQIGEPRIFNSIFTQQVEESNIRVDKGVGGGTLDDIGIYCINAARYLFQEEPIEVFATTASKNEPRFSKVAEMTSAILRFPNERLASFVVSFGAEKVSSYQVIGTKGDLRVEPAYAGSGEIKHYLTVNGDTQERSFGGRDQLAAEFVYFSDCILQDRQPEPSGQEGSIDVRIIQALYKSIETGRFVQLQPMQRDRRPDLSQSIDRPPLEQEPEMVRAAGPSGKS